MPGIPGTPDAPLATDGYTFTHEQLALYGAFELQVLEEFLRRPVSPESDALLADVCRRICRKIGWEEAVPLGHIRRFLTDFYTAERADLERGQLFGKLRADKTAAQKSAAQHNEIRRNGASVEHSNQTVEAHTLLDRAQVGVDDGNHHAAEGLRRHADQSESEQKEREVSEQPGGDKARDNDKKP